ncbi:MAG: flavocytochrome c [Coriobacteriales bacterium]|nr:flavocytochrome c [Coriobacteriales bacterium]
MSTKDGLRGYGQDQALIGRRSFLKTCAALGIVGMATGPLAGCMACSGSRSGSGGVRDVALAYDLVVVGAGGAGLTAAVSAKEHGVGSVVIFEKEGFNGGNTNFAASGMNASETKFQRARGIADTNKLFVEDTFLSGKENADIKLVEHLCHNSADAIEWLDGHGITLDRVAQMAGARAKRCHCPTDGSAIGKTLVPGLVGIASKVTASIRSLSRVSEVIMKDGMASGVKLVDGTVCNAKAVVLATGGFGANLNMVASFRQDLRDYVSTNVQGTTGDGLAMAALVGAQLIDMDHIQVYPTVNQKDGTLIVEALRDNGGILVNVKGERFVDEMAGRDEVSAAELEQVGGCAYVLYDQRIFDAVREAAVYEERGLTLKANTLEELAQGIGADPFTLQATVDAYNAVSVDGIADTYGRTQDLTTFYDGPFYANRVAPGIHHCMGGIRIDAQCRALTKDGAAIPGLFAAGETTGGIHGANRLGGNAICDIVVNGRTAGEQAARHILGL